MPGIGTCSANATLLITVACRHAALAQLVEHRIRNAGVTGSSPVGGTTQSQVSETIQSFPKSEWKSAHFWDFLGLARVVTGATETIPLRFRPS